MDALSNFSGVLEAHMDVDLSDPNRLITVKEAAELCGMSPQAFRAMDSRPAPDDPDLDRPANRRQPRWRLAAIVQWQATRVKRPRKRKEAADGGVPGQDD